MQRPLNHRNSCLQCPTSNYNEEKLHCFGLRGWVGQGGFLFCEASSKCPQGKSLNGALFAYYRLDIGTLAASRRCPATFCEMFIKSTLQQLRCAATHSSPALCPLRHFCCNVLCIFSASATTSVVSGSRQMPQY